MINRKYRKMIEQIKVDGEEYSDEEMKPVYVEQKKSLDNLHILLGSLFIKYGINGLIKIGASQSGSIEVRNRLKNIGGYLGDIEVKKVTEILSKVYEDTYYKNAFVLDNGMKINLKFDILKKEFIDAAVNTKYKDELFSDRIWKNKADMIDKLQISLTDAMKGNTTIDKVAKDIKNIFNVHAYESQRLVHTETARIATQGSLDIARSNGIEEVMWSATLDGKTADEDAALDGKRWGINEDYPTPPLHPNCRCCLINIPFSDWQPTQRMDNESRDTINYKDYDTWLKDKGVEE